MAQWPKSEKPKDRKVQTFIDREEACYLDKAVELTGLPEAELVRMAISAQVAFLISLPWPRKEAQPEGGA